MQRLIEADLEWENASPLHHLVTYADENYPPLLKEVKGSPPALFVYGDPLRLQFPTFGVVGPRTPSREGIKNAAIFSSDLARQGICIVSGLAYGIDKTAHEQANKYSGKTIAVIGTGIDITYPVSHKPLTDEIANNGGAVVSIFPRNTKPLPTHFPARNRIISGISLGVLVVEAGERSGASITARCAIEQGREVFAIPGSIHDPLSKGTNSLIKQGANLVENYLDIIDHLKPIYESYNTAIKPVLQSFEQSSKVADKVKHRVKNTAGIKSQATKQDYVASIEIPGTDLDISPSETEILKLLAKGGLSVDELTELLSMPINKINSSLMNMELQGLVYQEKGIYKRAIA